MINKLKRAGFLFWLAITSTVINFYAVILTGSLLSGFFILVCGAIAYDCYKKA